jgi:Spy/CpxP family protein refolding chaperone
MRENRFYFASLIAVAFIALSAYSAFAQGRGPGKKHWEKIEMLRIWKLADVLKFEEDEMAKIIPIIRTYHATVRDKSNERESAIRNIRKELRKSKGMDSKKITQNVKRATDMEAEVVKIRQDHYRQMGKHLNAEQMGRYLIFEIRFQDEIRNFMTDIKGWRGRRGGRGRMRGQEPPSSVEETPAPLPKEDD